MELETLLYEQEDGVAVITMNRPEVHNAFNHRMQAELHGLWRHLPRLPQVDQQFAKNRRWQPAAQQPQHVHHHALGAVTGHDGTASHRQDEFIEKGQVRIRQRAQEHHQQLSERPRRRQ